MSIDGIQQQSDKRRTHSRPGFALLGAGTLEAGGSTKYVNWASLKRSEVRTWADSSSGQPSSSNVYRKASTLSTSFSLGSRHRASDHGSGRRPGRGDDLALL